MAKRRRGDHRQSSRVMEVVKEENNCVHLARQTRINDLPKNIIANILDRMPIQEAVRTSIFSRSWRFNWTMLTRLKFDQTLFQYLQKKIRKELLLVTYAKIISRALFRHQGNILKFDLCRLEGLGHDEMSDWILFLTGKGMEEFALYSKDSIISRYKLPTHFCLLTKLTYLKLEDCCFQATPGFRGFPNLKYLHLWSVTFERVTSWNFIAGCLHLDILELYDVVLESDVHNVAKLQNLKKFTCHICHFPLPDAIINLFRNLTLLPKLKEVNLCDLSRMVSSEEVRTKHWVSAVFKCLGVFGLSGLTAPDHFFLTRELFYRSPNLHEVSISLAPDVSVEIPASYWENDCCNLGQLQIVTLVFFIGSRNQLRLVKFLLACSPSLEKMSLYYSLGSNQVSQLEKALRISQELMKFHRASSKAEINFLYK